MEQLKCSRCKVEKPKECFKGDESSSDSKYFNTCRKNKNTYYIKRGEELFKSLKCRFCRKDLSNNKDYLCIKCRKKKRLREKAKKKEYYNIRLLKGLCVRCGLPREDLLKSRCIKCLLEN